MVKAQVHAGGRGKAGFIKLAETPEQAGQHAAAMLGQTFKGFKIERLLIEEAVDIAAEHYLAVLIDRATRSPDDGERDGRGRHRRGRRALREDRAIPDRRGVRTA